MKKRTLLTLASIYIACAGYAQQQVEPAKMDRIQKDPTSYQNNGGIIDSDQMIAQPEKSQKVVDPEGKFIIYKNSNSKEIEGVKDYILIKDQTSEEYRLAKEKYILSNPQMNPADEEATPRSAQERNKIYNKK